MLGLLLAAVVLSLVAPPFPRLAALQTTPTVIMLVAAPFLLRRWPLEDRHVACVVGFLLLHTVAGRYIYSFVPYDQWLGAIGLPTTAGAFGWERNHFDRLVHFAFGLLFVPPIAAALIRYIEVRPRYAFYIAIEFVAAGSALYEVFEWLLTLVAAGEDADAYNGQQGDLWDAQKDMALAMAGAFTALGLTLYRRRREARLAPAPESAV